MIACSPIDPFDTVAAPESADVPFLVGSTKDEATLFVGPFPQWGRFTEAEVLEHLQPLAGARAQQALGLYKSLHPDDSLSYLLADTVTDFWMRQAANRVAELKVDTGSRAGLRLCARLGDQPRVAHTARHRCGAGFRQFHASPAIGAAAEAQAVADQMSAAWVAFARTGIAEYTGASALAAVFAAARPNMAFNIKSRVVDDYGRHAREFWESA